MAELGDPLIGVVEVAEFLGVTAQTLGIWARKGKGPAWHMVGAERKYRREDVLSWLAAQPAGGEKVSA
jgi:excisionase family DNA binding protein